MENKEPNPKIIQFVALDLRGVWRRLFLIKIQRQEFFYIDKLGGYEFKISKHGERGGKYRSHLKIAKKEVPKTRNYSKKSITQIQGIEFVGGSGSAINKLSSYQVASENNGVSSYPIALDMRQYYQNTLSTVQWSIHLLEPDNLSAIFSSKKIQSNKATKNSEVIGLFIYKNTNPWIVVEFSKIKIGIADLYKQPLGGKGPVNLCDMIRGVRPSK